MHIGIDIDGVLSAKDYTHISRRAVIALLFLFSKLSPDKVKEVVMNQRPHEEIDIARNIASKHKISIITARPVSIKSYTEQWLQDIAKIPYENIFFVGLQHNFASRKLNIAKEESIELFLDDTHHTIDLFMKNGIKAHYFTSWKNVERLINTI